MIKEAQDFAKEKHNGQLYGSLDYYEKHLVSVANIAMQLCSNLGQEMFAKIIATAYLHDTIKCGKSTYKEIKEIFGEEIADSVSYLTYNKAKGYDEYFKNISRSIIARIVKVSDRIDEIRSLCEGDRRDNRKLALKYSKELEYFYNYRIFPRMVENELNISVKNFVINKPIKAE
jgi:(p)ppGpp synthase/HD superfamily hydrolase